MVDVAGNHWPSFNEGRQLTNAASMSVVSTYSLLKGCKPPKFDTQHVVLMFEKLGSGRAPQSAHISGCGHVQGCLKGTEGSRRQRRPFAHGRNAKTRHTI
jgi:hypothetical protein